jgi:KDO2-lipid IV(A) lauroyltransferase
MSAEPDTATYRGSGWPGVGVDRRPGAAGRLPPESRRERPVVRLRAVAWLLGWELARTVPERLAFAAADGLAWLAYRRAGATRRRVRRTLARVVGDGADAVVAAAFGSYARYWVEAFRAADLDPADLDRRTTTGGFEHLDDVLDRGRGAIVLLAHHGSWDLAARWAESHGYHLAVVAEVLRPRRLFDTFARLRERMGLEVVPLRGGEDLLGRLSAVLAENHLVGLLSDRDLTGRAPLAQLFGEPCRLPQGPVALARRTGAPIVPITMLQRPGRRWHLQVLPAIDVSGSTVREGMAAVAGALEALICLAPEQWHAFQPVFEADRDAAASRRP